MQSKITKIIIATIIVIGGFSLFYFFQNKSEAEKNPVEFDLPKSFFVDEKTEIALNWTDDNKDEDLIIQSDKKSYFGINKSEIYFSVSSINKNTQNFNLRFLFGEESAELEKIEKINSGGATSKLSQTENPFVNFDNMKDFKSSLYIEDIIQSGQTNYYKATITYNPNTKGEFYIEAKGEQGAYGLLDPWYNSTGLVGYWSFDGADIDWSATTAEVIDRSGQGNHGDAVDMSNTDAIIGRVGQALEFDETNYIFILEDPSFDFTSQDNFSISVWVNMDLNTDNYDPFVGKAASSSSDGFMLRHSTDGNISARLEDTTDTSQAVALSSGYDYRDGQWHYITMVVDWTMNDMSLYIDGVKRGQDTNISDIAEIENNYNLNIGALGSGVKLNGKLDEVAIFNRALSPDEITDLYRLGGRKSQIKTTGTNKMKINTSTVNRLTDNLIGHWTFDGADIDWSATTAEVIDRSGNGNNGNAINIDTSNTVIGKIGQALYFENDSDRIDFDTDLGSSFSELTVSAWVYPTLAPDGLGRVVVSTYDYDINPALARGWSLESPFGAADSIHFRGLDSSGNQFIVNKSNFFADNLNKWTHVVGVFKSSESAILYIDGVSVSFDTSSVPSEIVNGGIFNIRIGSRADNTIQGPWRGSIDEVRIYDRALSTDEITELYQMGTKKFKIK